MNKVFVFLILMLAIVFSCSYDPEGCFLNPIEPPGSPNAINISLDDSADTIIIRFFDRWVKLNFDTKPYQVLGGKIILNGDSIGAIGRVNFTHIQIEISKLDVGENKLKIELYTNSNSGSLADLAEIEGYVFTKELVIYKYSDVIEPMEFYGEPYEGTYRVRWSKYNMYDFCKYRLTDYFGSHEYMSTTCADSVCFIDTTVVEGWGNDYLLDVEVLEKGWLNIIDNPLYSFNYPKKILNGEYIGNYKVKLSWEPTMFYKNLRKYQLWRGAYGNRTLIFETDDWTKTEWVEDSIPVGGSVDFYLAFVPKDDYWKFQENSCSHGSIQIGERFSLNYSRVLPYPQKILRFDDGNINCVRIVNEHDMSIYQTINFSNHYNRLLISNKGKIIYGVNDLGLTLIDCYTFQEGQTIFFNDLKSSSSYEGDFDLAKCFLDTDEKGNIYFFYRGYFPPANGMFNQIRYRYNIDSRLLERIKAPHSQQYELDYSMDGTKMILNTCAVYKLTNGEYHFEHSFNSNWILDVDPFKAQITTINHNKDKIFTYDINNYSLVEYLELAEGSHIKCVSPNLEKALIFDASKKNIGDILTVIDLHSRERLFSFPCIASYGYELLFLNYVYLANHRISFDDRL